MIKEQGTVSGVDGDIVTIQSSLKSGCSGCAQQNKCGAGLLAKAFPQRRGDISIRTQERFEQGQQVELEMAESTMAKYSVLMYLFPLFALLAGAAIGSWLQPEGEGLAILLAMSLFALSFAALKSILRCSDFKVQRILAVRAAAKKADSAPS